MSKSFAFLLLFASYNSFGFDKITTAAISHSVYRPYRFENTVLLKNPEYIKDGIYKIVLCKAHFCNESMQTIFYDSRWKRLFGVVTTESNQKEIIGYPTYDERKIMIDHVN